MEEWIDWFDWMRGIVGYWPKVFLRARMRALVLGVLFFCCHKCHSGWVENISLLKKRRVVLLKTTCRFMESDVSFYGKQRVVFDWRSKSRFEDGVLVCFWDGVAA